MVDKTFVAKKTNSTRIIYRYMKVGKQDVFCNYKDENIIFEKDF